MIYQQPIAAGHLLSQDITFSGVMELNSKIEDFFQRNHIILHLPHASLYIPDEVRANILLDDQQLDHELLAITDRYTDELFTVPGVRVIKSPVSRLVVDMERFRSDDDEVMARVGMGAVYESTSGGEPLRYLSSETRDRMLQQYYDPYHKGFEEVVEACLASENQCLIIDCHSFPSRPLPYELDQDPDRPEICLGICDYHTPPQLKDFALNWMTARFSVAVNRPFAGTFVPSRYYHKDKRVSSIMIEVNRSLYMDEATGNRNDGFERIKALMGEFISGVQ